MKMSSFVRVDYYRCRNCWHVWSVNRTTGETIQHVTPLKPEQFRHSSK
jgi:hypothetical protein